MVEKDLIQRYDKALTWIFEHCETEEDYIKALLFIGFSIEEVEKEIEVVK